MDEKEKKRREGEKRVEGNKYQNECAGRLARKESKWLNLKKEGRREIKTDQTTKRKRDIRLLVRVGREPSTVDLPCALTLTQAFWWNFTVLSLFNEKGDQEYGTHYS